MATDKFDQLFEALEGMQKQYDALNTSIPKLAEQKRQLKVDIDKLNKQYMVVKDKIDTAVENFKVEMAEGRNEIQDGRVQLEEDKVAHQKEVNRFKAEAKKRLDAVDRHAATLDEVAEAQKLRQDELNRQSGELANKTAELNEEEDRIRKREQAVTKREEDVATQNALSDSILKEAQENFDKSEQIKIEAGELLQKAKGWNEKAFKKADGLDDRIARVEMREDEQNRRETLLKDRETRLAKKEAALEDRKRVYASH